MFVIVLAAIVLAICIALALMTINPMGIMIAFIVIAAVAGAMVLVVLWWQEREQTVKRDAGQGSGPKPNDSGPEAQG